MPPHHGARAQIVAADTINPASIRASLSRILASPQFSGSSRKSGFLKFVVERSLAGRNHESTAYDIAIHVLGRDERFDPQSNPLVRIAARRLRDALEQYYLTGGQDDRIRIAIPKGHYVPRFYAVQGTEEPAPAGPLSVTIGKAIARDSTFFMPRAIAAALLVVAFVVGAGAFAVHDWAALTSGGSHFSNVAASKSGHPRLAIARIGGHGADPILDDVAQLVTQELRIVIGRGDQFQLVEHADGADLLLDGSVRRHASQLRIQFLLRSAQTSQILWTNAYLLDDAMGLALVDAKLSADLALELSSLYPNIRSVRQRGTPSPARPALPPGDAQKGVPPRTI